ncbi:MAG: protein-L-isoaspartate(D-aspartate) O-methyltransferase [Nitrospinaceae bacterium]|nr:protein-L-isoaspartate(D-aspartate) O-methyltransferase [Nitrospinaceae bacterium]NIR56839.1 protein-L-isoaspartate(D-aspartate) O-methyltransferase [Nitrospinaceae bacterium]NIS87306.1 protein-L-isoaspartate(D-aspartate) O-methyltransferase [Nitrospinaceae bacterium]NIT84159.1 protein-L-isoaspartate(D-aspartate) O-methyltransferase [Nitrospinaceae bacterium]NIU46346.1 protein-L-isoaspartate(D-aspartate) O-methyltransferase [Nitrospinaceae bacterium]
MNLTAQSLKQYAGHRQKMVEELFNRGIKDLRVIEAMSRVPRHLFVRDTFHHKAYGDHPLPIGDSQTISQPYIVAVMTEALQLTGEERVLEIGTGSGYQTAILSELAAQVFTIERVKSLGRQAKQLLDGLGYTHINYKIFDGTYGWRELGPYDAMMITAAGPQVPKALIEQVKDGGRIVAPVGHDSGQELMLFTRRGDRLASRRLTDCFFVPLIGKYGVPEAE